MSEPMIEGLERQLKQLFGESAPHGAVHDIHAALDLARQMEARGFSFQLKDLRPKSRTETLWRAVFVKDGETFSADHPVSAMAVCTAAVATLDRQ